MRLERENMIIADNILKDRLKNVYFIWGSGKTTAANALAQKYGFYVYHTDYSRSRHFRNADPDFQPSMCRDVPDFFALEREEALQWEKEVVREMTPMIIMDLAALASHKKAVICEGDIDVDQIISVVTNAVTISNHGADYDFFARPEQKHILEDVKNRTDIDDKEKSKLIKNAYNIIYDKEDKFAVPRETKLYGVKQIIRDNMTSAERVAEMIAEYWSIAESQE